LNFENNLYFYLFRHEKIASPLAFPAKNFSAPCALVNPKFSATFAKNLIQKGIKNLLYPITLTAAAMANACGGGEKG
jgi:hypothetical protein